MLGQFPHQRCCSDVSTTAKVVAFRKLRRASLLEHPGAALLSGTHSRWLVRNSSASEANSSVSDDGPSSTKKEQQEKERRKRQQRKQQLESNLEWKRRLQKEWDTKRYEDKAWAIHLKEMEESSNQYATVRALAGVMAQVEIDDHVSGNTTTLHIPSWSRAETAFEKDFPTFNEYVRENLPSMVWKPLPGANEEEFDILDDVLLLEDGIQDEDQEEERDEWMNVDRYMDGVLPGAMMSEESQSYMEDILVDESGDDDVQYDD